MDASLIQLLGAGAADVSAEAEALKASFKVKAKDGLTLQEIIAFVSECVTVLIPRIEAATGDAAARKKVLTQVVRDIYWSINPDIPWIPEPLETMLENIAINIGVASAIERWG